MFTPASSAAGGRNSRHDLVLRRNVAGDGVTPWGRLAAGSFAALRAAMPVGDRRSYRAAAPPSRSEIRSTPLTKSTSFVDR